MNEWKKLNYYIKETMDAIDSLQAMLLYNMIPWHRRLWYSVSGQKEKILKRISSLNKNGIGPLSRFLESKSLSV